jgi:hypothetical protein
MSWVDVRTNNHNEEVRFQRYRLEVIAAWPENEFKRSVMAAAEAVLQRELAFEASVHEPVPAARTVYV